MVERPPSLSLQGTALEALKAIPQICGLNSNVGVRAWMISAALERGDRYETEGQLEQMAEDARLAVLVGSMTQAGQIAVQAATNAVISWARWVRSGRRGNPCKVCDHPDFYGDLDERGVCLRCRDAAAEAGVEIKLPAAPTPVQAYCDPAQDDWDDEGSERRR